MPFYLEELRAFPTQVAGLLLTQHSSVSDIVWRLLVIGQSLSVALAGAVFTGLGGAVAVAGVFASLVRGGRESGPAAKQKLDRPAISE